MNERIKEERKRLGMSQKVCALYGGVDGRTQRKYEQGESPPDVDYLGKLHKFAPGIDVLYILTGQRQAQTGVTLTPRQAALLDNYEHTSEEGKKIIEGAAFAAAQPAAPVKGSAKRAA